MLWVLMGFNVKKKDKIIYLSYLKLRNVLSVFYFILYDCININGW